MQGIESLCKHFIESKHRCRVISLEECIHQREAILIIKHIQVTKHILILHISTAERHSLVKDRKSVTHGTICLMSNHMKRLIVNGDSLARSHHSKILHDVLDSDSVEVICLTSRKDSRKNLMFLSCSKNENRMCRRFLERLEECIECSLREHVHLVDDIDAVSAHLRRYAHLVHQSLDILDTIVGSGIKFMNTIRPAFRERKA